MTPSPSRMPFAGAAARAATSGLTRMAADELRRSLPSLDQAWQTAAHTNSSAVSPSAHAYYRHYLLGDTAQQRYLGALAHSYGGRTEHVAVQTFVPAVSTTSTLQTVLLLHGYLDHLGLNRSVVEELLRAGFVVCAVDLPGHGLSGGGRGTIGDFAEYAAVLQRLIAEIRAGRVPGVASTTSLCGLGHSTGATALLEYLEQGGAEIEALVFLAPLIRLFAFPLARLGVRLTSGVVDTLPRRISGSSSNEEYMQFAREFDPLGIYEASLEWAEAYLLWEERRREIEAHTLPLLLVQAGRDTVVDAEYNTAFLQRSFTELEYLHYPEARHSIFTEPHEKRPGLYKGLLRFLAAP
ncbi:MAG: alpha/beta hydrolase [Spirochaetaceae bacterium]|nr:MAG: alpha/beta hydrolase [Spirochaetaceae bacterium]